MARPTRPIRQLLAAAAAALAAACTNATGPYAAGTSVGLAERYDTTPRTSIRQRTEQGDYYFPSTDQWRRLPVVPREPDVRRPEDRLPLNPPSTLRERAHRRDYPQAESPYVPSGQWDGTRWKPNPTWKGRPDRFRP